MPGGLLDRGVAGWDVLPGAGARHPVSHGGQRRPMRLHSDVLTVFLLPRLISPWARAGPRCQGGTTLPWSASLGRYPCHHERRLGNRRPFASCLSSQTMMFRLIARLPDRIGKAPWRHTCEGLSKRLCFLAHCSNHAAEASQAEVARVGTRPQERPQVQISMPIQTNTAPCFAAPH